MVTDDPTLLRLYARVFDKPRRHVVGGPIYSPSEFCRAAAVALRERADRIESQRRGPDAPPIDLHKESI